jgi:hypothetical protein
MSGDAKKSWHLTKDGEKFGPYTSQELAELGKEGRIAADTMVWREGMEKWQPASKVKGLQVTPVAPAPPPAPAMPAFTVAVAPAHAAAPMPVKGHVTIEKTGKSLKMQQLLGLLCIVLGLVLVGLGVSANTPGSREPSALAMVGAPLFVLGLAWRIVTRMRIWWHHG